MTIAYANKNLLRSLSDFGLNPRDWMVEKISELHKSYRVRLTHVSDAELVLEGWVTPSDPIRFSDLHLHDLTQNDDLRIN